MPDEDGSPTLDELLDKALANWNVVPELHAAGVSASYRDKQGRLVRHYPDGTIEVIEEPVESD